MLVPVSVHLSPAARSPSAGGQANAAAAIEPPSALPPSRSSAAGLTSELAERMEQDLDYQILRRSFDLDRAVPRDVSSGRSGESVSASSSAAWARDARRATLEVGSEGAVGSTSSLELRWSSNQEWAVRLDASIGGSDSGSSLLQERVRRQSVELDLRVQNGGQVERADPLVLDLSGEGITTTGVEAGVRFDLDADGQEDQTSFVTGASWLLALDRNENGRIDDGKELFGDQHGASNGFEELARFDDNRDGVVDAADQVFDRLRLLQIGEDGEQVLASLAEAGVSAIELGYQNTRKALNLYDTVAQMGAFRRADGTSGEAADLLLGYSKTA